METALAECLRAIETGDAFDRQQLLDRFPHWTEELTEFMASHAQITTMATSWQQPVAPRPPLPHLATLPAVVGDYEVTKLIAVGGMGAVYRARQISLDRTVALKFLLGTHDAQRFRAEAEAAAALGHPNIVAIYEIGDFQGHPFYSMQFIDGADLRSRMGSDRMSPDAAAKLVWKLAGVIEFAHQRGVLHRDLKPGNVLVDRAGEPLITDFGLAKRFRDDSHRTGTGALLGTPSYMSPEQVIGDPRTLTTSVDVYGLGALLYALLTGRAPLEGSHPMQVMHRVVHEAPRPPRESNEDISPDLEMICLKCLEKRPDDRYHSAFDLQADLARYLGGHPVMARPVGKVERALRWCRRNPLVAGLAGAVAILMVLAAVGGTSLAWREYQARRKMESSQTREREASQRAHLNLVNSYTNNGRHAQTTSRQAEALLWYAAAADIAKNMPQVTDALVRAQRRQRFVPRPVRAALMPQFKPTTLAFDASGRYVFLADNQERLDVWDLAAQGDPQRITILDSISRFALSDDGRRLALGNASGRLRVVDLTTGQVELAQEFSAGIAALTFGPQSKQLYVGVGNSVTRLPLDGARERVASAPEPTAYSTVARVDAIVVNPAGTRLLVMDAARGVLVFDLTDGERRPEPLFPPLVHEPLTELPAGVTVAPCFVRDDRIAVSSRGQIQFREATTGAILASADVGAHFSLLSDVRRGRFAVGTSRQSQVRSSAEISQLVQFNHREPVTHLCFHPQRDLLAAGSADGRVNLWELASRRGIGDLMHQTAIAAIQFSPQGNLLATIQRDGLVRVWEMPGPVVTRRSQTNAAAVVWAKPHNNGASWFEAGSPPDQARLTRWRSFATADGTLHETELPLPGYLCDSDFAEDQGLVVTSIKAGTVTNGGESALPVYRVHFWQWPSGEEAHPPLELPCAASSIACQPGGKLAAAALTDGQIWMMDLDDFTVVKKSPNPQWPEPPATVPPSSDCRQVAFSPDGQWLVAFDGCAGVQVLSAAHDWSVVAQPASTLSTHCEFDSKSQHLAIAMASGEVLVWDLAAQQQRGPTLHHDEMVFRVRFSPNGELVATASADNFARIFEWRSGQMTCPAMPQRNDVFDALFSPDGEWLFTIGDNSLVVLWSIRDGGFVDQFPISGPSGSVQSRQRAARLMINREGNSVVASGWRRAIDWFDIGSLSTGTATNTSSLLSACELAACARIEQGGVCPLATRDWMEQWLSYSQAHPAELSLEFSGSQPLPWDVLRPSEQ